MLLRKQLIFRRSFKGPFVFLRWTSWQRFPVLKQGPLFRLAVMVPHHLCHIQCYIFYCSVATLTIHLILYKNPYHRVKQQKNCSSAQGKGHTSKWKKKELDHKKGYF